MHHKGTQIIETPRLILRPFTMDGAHWRNAGECLARRNDCRMSKNGYSSIVGRCP